MEKMQGNREIFLYGISKMTGISKKRLDAYPKEENIFFIMDHPDLIAATDAEMEKLKSLKQFINSYNFLRKQEKKQKIQINTPKKAGDYFMSYLGYEKQRERILVAYLDSKSNVLSCELVGKGTVNACYIFPRELLKRAIQLDCDGIILAHVHPSGNPTPSREDKGLTQRMVDIFQPIGIKMLDHIIIGNDDYYSFTENGLICSSKEKAEYSAIPVQRISEQDDELCF